MTEASEPLPLLAGCTYGAAGDPCLRDWQTSAESIYATNGALVGLTKKSSVATDHPDLFAFCTPAHFTGYFPGYSKALTSGGRSLSWLLLKADTTGRAGSVRLRTADPRDPPHIDLRYFDPSGAPDRDLQAMVDGVRLLRQISFTTALLSADLEMTEVYPGPGTDTDASLAAFIQDECWGHHACGTCAIGPDGDRGAVLDSQLRVRDPSSTDPGRTVRGLRVVDASVFPRIPGFFIVTSIYMVSEESQRSVDCGVQLNAAF